MDNEILQRLIAIPEIAKSYASDLSELNFEHIPWDRVPEFKQIMQTSSSEYDRVWAARVLAEWGDDDGYDFLESYVSDSPSSANILMAHRLRGYDDTNTQILSSVVSYWAVKSDAGFGEEIRKKIFKSVSQLITLSNTMPFEISGAFWLVKRQNFTEYLPLLKEHLQAIIQRAEFHYWKVADCAHFLMQYDPEFVTQTLAAHGKTLADFPSK